MPFHHFFMIEILKLIFSLLLKIFKTAQNTEEFL